MFWDHRERGESSLGLRRQWGGQKASMKEEMLTLNSC